MCPFISHHRALRISFISITTRVFLLFLHQILICLDLYRFPSRRICLFHRPLQVSLASRKSHLLIEFYNPIYNCVIDIAHLDTDIMLSNGHCRLFTRCRKFSLLLLVLFYVLSVFHLTCLIGRARTSSSTHQLGKCQHTLKLRYGVKRNSQPLILYHFFSKHSGRIDV